jgi:branched-chain amino acid transport system substrate-binding protein
VAFTETSHCGAEDLLTNPKTASPYLTRFSESTTLLADPGADWAYNAGFRKAIVMTSDFAGGLQIADAFASTFVKKGGQIVQELYPPLGTNDFGPFLAQISPQADVLFSLLIGSDGLRFGQQYGNYVAGHKLQIIDQQGNVTAGPNLAQLQDKAVGINGTNTYLPSLDTPANKKFLAAFQAKYPGRYVSGDVQNGYASAQILQAALEKVNGNIEDTQKFLDALYATDVETPSGPIKLDKDHDVVRNLYVFKVVKQGSDYVPQPLHTYDAVSRTWDRTQAEIDRFPFGTLKGKWVGMTPDKLKQLTG